MRTREVAVIAALLVAASFLASIMGATAAPLDPAIPCEGHMHLHGAVDHRKVAEKAWSGSHVSGRLKDKHEHMRDCARSDSARKRMGHQWRKARTEWQRALAYTPYAGPNGTRWAIPYYIVACESGGQNLSPNSASAAGYYQIISSTWYAYGGGQFASEADYATKAEQDIVAYRISSGGSSFSQWDCA